MNEDLYIAKDTNHMGDSAADAAHMAKQTISQAPVDALIGPLNPVERKFAPPILYYSGDRTIFNHPRVSIVGSRQPSESGLQKASDITKELVRHGIVIVSGLARGIDTIAHSITIEHHGRTIACLGTPLDKTYPAENRSLQETIMQHHLAISQFEQGSTVTPNNFRQRNRTMALISHATIIIEAGEKSGTIHQAWEAIRLGRPLFIADHLFDDPKLTWPHKLAEYGARLLRIDDVEQIIEELPSQGTMTNVTL